MSKKKPHPNPTTKKQERRECVGTLWKPVIQISMTSLFNVTFRSNTLKCNLRAYDRIVHSLLVLLVQCSSISVHIIHLNFNTNLTRPIWLPVTDTHSHLLAQLQLSNLLPWLTTRKTDMVNLSVSLSLFITFTFSLSKHDTEACRNDCI